MNSHPRSLPLSKLKKVLLLGAALLASPDSGWSQEATIALGKVGPDGVLYHSSNTLAGVVTTSRLANGHYQIDVTAPGAFAGAGVEDFVLQVTPTNSASDDEIAVVQIQSVTNDTILARARLADVEDAGDLDTQVAVDTGFFFNLLRIRSGARLDRSTRSLAATGRVTFDGTLVSSAHPVSYGLATSRSSTGNYEIVLSRAGQFAADTANDYVLTLGVMGSGVIDEIIRGNTVVTASDDEVVFRVILDDAQDDSNDNLSTPEDRSFAFAIHRLVPSAHPESALLLALARVDGSNGNLVSGASSLAGATLSSQRNSTGRYRITLQKPGFLEGRFDHEFSAMAQVHFSGFADEFAAVNIDAFDHHTLHLDVAVNDVETSGTNLAVATDADFSLVLYEARPSYQADLRIGRTAAPSGLRGDNLYRPNASGQTLKLRTRSRRGLKVFQTLENDGNVVGPLRIRAKHRGRRVRVSHFRLTGGKTNVTPAMKGAGLVQSDLAPDTNVRLLTQIRFLGKKTKRATTLTTVAFSPHGGITDTTRATVKRTR